MLVNAMEVTGVDGTFKKICLESIDMCRSNKESILAVLEAFINGKYVAQKLNCNSEYRSRCCGKSTSPGPETRPDLSGGGRRESKDSESHGKVRRQRLQRS